MSVDQFTQKYGGPAFPTQTYEGGGDDDGMSLRDYFAAAALQGILAAYSGEGLKLPAESEAAVDAYDYADAMLEARKGN